MKLKKINEEVGFQTRGGKKKESETKREKISERNYESQSMIKTQRKVNYEENELRRNQ